MHIGRFASVQVKKAWPCALRRAMSSEASMGRYPIDMSGFHSNSETIPLLDVCLDTIKTSHRTMLEIGMRAVRLAYASYQPTNKVPDGPPLIMIHGLFGAKNNLATLSKVLGQTRKVVALDCRNHGESPHVPEMNYELMAEDVELLMHDLNIDSAHVFGHSMGGKLAMMLALTKPHLVSKLLVEDVSPNSTRTPFMTAFPGYLKAMKKVEFDNSLSSAAMRKSANKQLEKSFPETSVRNFIITNIVRRDNQYTWRVNIDAITNNLDNLVGFPNIDATYPGPTLFLGGSLSLHITDKDHPEIQRFFPSAQIKHIMDAGHWVHAEKPYDVLDATKEFFDGAPKS